MARNTISAGCIKHRQLLGAARGRPAMMHSCEGDNHRYTHDRFNPWPDAAGEPKVASQVAMTVALSCGRANSGSWAKRQPSAVLVKVQITSNRSSGHSVGGAGVTDGKAS